MPSKMNRRRLAAATLAVALGFSAVARLEAADVDTVQAAPAASSPAAAAASGRRTGRSTGFDIPRFVSLRAASAHMRVGPSTDYPTAWVYSARGLPMEIIEEYGNWRQVRDPDGASGWMLAPLLSGQRTAVVGPWLDKPIAMRREPQSGAGVVARLDPSVRVNIAHCDGAWCRVELQRQRLGGYVSQAQLWGVYPHERVTE